MTESSSNQNILVTDENILSSSLPISVENIQAAEHGDIQPPGKGLARNQAEAAQYIVEMLVVLCNMAKDVDLKFLNYLLEMAYEESTNHVGKAPVVVKSPSR